jgi:hypothetical protein
VTAFVNTLRVANEAPIVVGSADGELLHIRVQVADVWDAVTIDAAPDATVRDVKVRVLQELFPDSFPADQYVMKLRGIEILDENISIVDAGATNGSIFLIVDRRRRPVR